MKQTGSDPDIYATGLDCACMGDAVARAREAHRQAVERAKQIEEHCAKLGQAQLCQAISEALRADIKKVPLLGAKVAWPSWEGKFRIHGLVDDHQHWNHLSAALDAMHPAAIERFHQGEHCRRIQVGPNKLAPDRIAALLGWDEIASMLQAMELSAQASSTPAALPGKPRAL